MIILLPLHKRQCLVIIIFTNLPSLHPLSFHAMIFILVPPIFLEQLRDLVGAARARGHKNT